MISKATEQRIHLPQSMANTDTHVLSRIARVVKAPTTFSSASLLYILILIGF